VADVKPPAAVAIAIGPTIRITIQQRNSLQSLSFVTENSYGGFCLGHAIAQANAIAGASDRGKRVAGVGIGQVLCIKIDTQSIYRVITDLLLKINLGNLFGY
jgi:hypothetical protein